MWEETGVFYFTLIQYFPPFLSIIYVFARRAARQGSNLGVDLGS